MLCLLSLIIPSIYALIYEEMYQWSKQIRMFSKNFRRYTAKRGSFSGIQVLKLTQYLLYRNMLERRFFTNSYPLFYQCFIIQCFIPLFYHTWMALICIYCNIYRDSYFVSFLKFSSTSEISRLAVIFTK